MNVSKGGNPCSPKECAPGKSQKSPILPLRGLRVVEFGGIGPGPFAGMMLADAGARITRIDRPGAGREVFGLQDVTWRGRTERIQLNLKEKGDREKALAIVRESEALIEGFRPGVMERLGLGPEQCHVVQPALVYGRMTGWGQDSPKAGDVGHDINYLALSGCLHAIGDSEFPPPPPINFVGDYGGGGMMLAFGIAAAVLHARKTGEGAVVDAAMIDGAAIQSAQVQGWVSQGAWSLQRCSNFLDGGAPFYRCYEAACGGYVSVGAIEDKFYRNFLLVMKLTDDPHFTEQHDRARWPGQTSRLAKLFRERTRDDWVQQFAGVEACVEPVLSLEEARYHPANVARSVFEERDGLWHPAAAPRISRACSH